MRMLERLQSIYIKLYRSIPVIMPMRLKVLRDKSGRLLDVGCGSLSPKRLNDIFGEKFEYVGVDIQDLKSVLPKNWTFYQLDLEKDNLPFPAETFDVVIMAHILEHLSLSRAQGILREVYRVLKWGGIVYCEVPSIMSIFMPSISIGLKKEGTINFYDDPTHIRPYSKIALWHLLTSSSFKVMRLGTVRNWLKVLVAPIGIILAFVMRDRNMLASFLWDIFGFSNFAVAIKGG